jgi:hypothetical protein
MKGRPLRGASPRTAAQRVHFEGNTGERRRVAVTESDGCPERCGGVLVRRHDRRPGRRCGVCGTPEPGHVLEVVFHGRPVPMLILRKRSA